MVRRSAFVASAISAALLLLLIFRPPASPATPRNLQLHQQLVQQLVDGKALSLGILGGSISRMEGGYGDQVVDWLNRNWPPREGVHSLLNGAVSASESTLAAVCFDTLLQQDHHPSKVDLLIVEYAYNDAASPETASSAFESIVRQSLSRTSAVISLEFAGYSHHRGHIEAGKATNDFQNSVGNLQASVASLYSVPIVDVARFLYAFADAERLMNYTDVIHPNLDGHTLVATLVIEELVRRVASMPAGAEWLSRKAVSANGPSWLHPPPFKLNPSTSRYLASLPSLPEPLSSPSISAELAPLPPPAFSPSTSGSSSIIPWSCTISQIASTVPALRQSAIATQGFLYGPDESDGGPFRSRARPGFRTNSTIGEGEKEEGHLVFSLGRAAAVKSVALLYRRSWQDSGKAVVWVDQKREADRSSSRSGGCERRVDGQWEAETTQMALEVVCEEGEVEWEEGELYLHIVAQRRKYFKVYGYAKG